MKEGNIFKWLDNRDRFQIEPECMMVVFLENLTLSETFKTKWKYIYI